MPYGWTGHLLRVNLTKGTAEKEPLNMKWASEYIGGRGLGTRYLYEEMDPTVDALSPENMLIFATGPLTGTYAPTGGRYMVICKSPLTDAVACSNSGGYWGPELKFAGYDMVILEGKAPKPVYIWIENDKVEIRDAAHVWGKNTEETEDTLRAETDPSARISGIGPAGENLNRVACIINDKSRAAGRSGVGAVMGSKNLKAIAVRGTGAVQCADPLEFGRLVFEAMKDINESPTTSKALRGLGTASTVGFTNSVGILPTNNFQVGQFEHANAISGPTIATTVLRRNKGCYSCPIGCARVTEIKPGGKYSGRGEGPEYETIFGLGSDCGVGDLDAVLYTNYLCNLYAVDTISAGGTVATAMELNESGYIPQEDLAEVGTELKFGNADAVVRCLEMMSYPDGKFSRLLAEGGYRLAEHYGHPELFMGSKKQDFAAYDARGAEGDGPRLRHLEPRRLPPARLLDDARVVRPAGPAARSVHDRRQGGGAGAAAGQGRRRGRRRRLHLRLLRRDHARQALADVQRLHRREPQPRRVDAGRRAHLEHRAPLQQQGRPQPHGRLAPAAHDPRAAH